MQVSMMDGGRTPHKTMCTIFLLLLQLLEVQSYGVHLLVESVLNSFLLAFMKSSLNCRLNINDQLISWIVL